MLPWIITYSWTFCKFYVVHHFDFCNDKIFLIKYLTRYMAHFSCMSLDFQCLNMSCFFLCSMIWGERLLFILLMYWYNFCPSLFKLSFHITNMTISSMFYKQVVHVLVNLVFKFVLFLQEFPSSSDFKSSLWIFFLKV